MRYTPPSNQKNDLAYASRGSSGRNSTSGRSKYSLWDVDADKQSITYDSGDKLLPTIDYDDDKSSADFSDDEDESRTYPHPLGFQNVDDNTNRLGLTRFTLFDEDSDQEEEEEEEEEEIDNHQPLFLQNSHHQSQYLPSQQQKLTLLPKEVQIRTSVLPYTGLSLHTVGSANPTALLLQHILLSHRNKTLLPKKDKMYSTKSNNHSVSLYCEMDRIADQLRYAANFSSSDEHPQAMHWNDLFLQKQLPAPLGDLSETARRVQQKITHMIEKEKEKVQRDYEESANALLLLLEKEERESLLIEEKERREEEEHARVVAEKKKEQEVEEERLANVQKEAELKRMEQEEEARIAKLMKEKKIAEAENERKKKEEREREHIVKAHKLVAQLKQLRSTIEPFESSKVQPIPKRRLHYKKLIRGKLNTLTHDPQKIRHVSTEIIETVAHAKQEDEQLKGQAQQQQTPELSCGKRYLLDLLASNVIVRAQSEQFSSSRGDGFPLACTVALVAAEVKELCPLVAAHIYSVCPMAIPYLPEGNSDLSEDELMESLGMIRESSGQYETFDRFISRTEGLISMTAAIMSSEPDGQSILGHPLKWLVRFLSILPKAPSQLPIVTSPVLVAFLTAAGPMLARKYPTEFSQIFNRIISDILPRADSGSLGAPSLVRLRKTLEGGVEHFESTVPKGAVPEMYISTNQLLRSRGMEKNSSENMQRPNISGLHEPNNPFVTPFGRPSSLPNNSSNNSAPTSSPQFNKDVRDGSTSSVFQIEEPDMDTAQDGFQGNDEIQGKVSFGPFPTSNSASSWSSIPVTAPFPSFSTPSVDSGSSFPGSGSVGTSSFRPLNPFGSSQSISRSPFGNQTISANPFSSSQNTSSNPFGSTQKNAQSNPFSLSRQGSGSFHRSTSNYSESSEKSDGYPGSNRVNAQLCKFFLQGRCRNGEYCKFSHNKT